jgi:flap endonuclease GEN
MTVSSLWKALDTAGCGTPVGAAQLTGLTTPTGATSEAQTLAVDLSIWICESLSVQGLNERSSNPALHLVFARTMKLLQLGLKLIFVVEGKKRIRDDNNDVGTFRERRSGTLFWKACNECQKMLEMLGVPVVRAKSEGEALCALLNDRGIVDGVLSNDSDCLLFGAKVVYTKYSNENLDNGRVMRYELNNLFAVVDANDDPDINAMKAGTVQLSRTDLIAFALLTGSDLAGSGLEKVGHKKAVRFIRKCQLDNPLSKATASLDEMRSWAKAAAADFQHRRQAVAKEPKCCTRCTHSGSRRNHEIHGCIQCGTVAGELCFLVTSDDRFRKSLRDKALAVFPNFDPSQVLSVYMRPNENQLPLRIAGCQLTGIQMGAPCLSALMQSTLIVKGRSLGESRAYIQQAVVRLLSRQELRRPISNRDGVGPSSTGQLRERPTAKAILKELTKNQESCYEVAWIIAATMSDDNGDGVDGLEYQTVEPRYIIKEKYPHLVCAFEKQKIQLAKQGDGMQRQRRQFLESYCFNAGKRQLGMENENQGEQEMMKKRTGRVDKLRQDFYQNHSLQVRRFEISSPKRRRGSKVQSNMGDDIGNLLRFVQRPIERSRSKLACNSHSFGAVENKASHDAVDSFPTYWCESGGAGFACRLPNHRARDENASFDMNNEACSIARALFPAFGGNEHASCTPLAGRATPVADEALFCQMGGFGIAITPIESNRGMFPPRHIFAHLNSSP